MIVYAPLKLIEGPKNPHGFNYKQFLKHQGVLHQISKTRV